MTKLIDAPKNLRPFLYHGVHLEWEGREQAVGLCPFCGREDGLFSVSVETSKWGCYHLKTCGHVGNAASFLMQLWEESNKDTTQHEALAQDRELLHTQTLDEWGIRMSLVSGEPLVPGFRADGKLCQLYRWLSDKETGKKRLLPTPGLWEDGKVHGMHGVNLLPKNCKEIWVAEGWGDGMVLWEVLQHSKLKNKCIGVVAVPGANIFQDGWLELFAGKRVVLFYDNDHPGKNPKTGRIREGAGIAGVKRVSARLLACKEPAKSVKYLRWGEGGYDLELKTGYDVRDFLTAGKDAAARVLLLDELLGKVAGTPDEWLKEDAGLNGYAGKIGVDLQPLPCHDWKTLINSWRKAMKWRQGLEDMLSVMLAVALSTEQSGDQLFLQVVGSASTGKTRMCDAMLVSKKCFPIEHLTGFHSGWNDGSGEDFSLLARMNHHCLITPEGDTIMTSHNFDEIMSQQRRIFDGSSTASYKNKKTEIKHTGLRTPWIMAGTPAMLDKDQSRLGDRFLRVWLQDPDEDEEMAILKRIGHAARRMVRVTSNCSPDTQLSPEMIEAYRLTGGYVDYLVANAERLLDGVRLHADDVARNGEVDHLDPDGVVDRCAALAQFTAYLRARPNPDSRKDSEACKEMPGRLMHQFVRLADCLAAVLGKDRVDVQVLDLVGKVALNTSKGRTLEICRELSKGGQQGLSLYGVTSRLGHTEDRNRMLLDFLRKIGAVRWFRIKKKSGISSGVRWGLSEKMQRLWAGVIKE